jgi:hypothetical protein
MTKPAAANRAGFVFVPRPDQAIRRPSRLGGATPLRTIVPPPERVNRAEPSTSETVKLWP